MSTSKRRVRIIAAAVAVPVLLVGAFLVGRSLWWGLRPIPEFPALATARDDTRTGTIAYVAAFPDDGCIWVVRAAGGSPRRVGCVRGSADGLRWRADGRLEGNRFVRTAEGGPTYRWIADVAERTIRDVPGSGRTPSKDGAGEEPVGPNGETVAFSSSRGRLTVTLTRGGTSRTLVSVGAPETYTFGQTAWSPDGSYFAVHDDLDRVLLVTTGADPEVLVVGEGGWGPAVTDAEPLGPLPEAP
jgi:hypothetical protein